jgi:hypothetical protein
MGEKAILKQVAPQFVVPDVVGTAEYYRDILGFKILGYFADPPVFSMVARDGVEIHFGKADTGEVGVNENVRKGLGSDAYISLMTCTPFTMNLLPPGPRSLRGQFAGSMTALRSLYAIATVFSLFLASNI